MASQTRAQRALVILTAHPDGLTTAQICQMLGEYPWAMKSLLTALNAQETLGYVTGKHQRGNRTSVHWKITGDAPTSPSLRS